MFEINQLGAKIYRNKKRQYHREDGPALECADGTKFWYINGRLHRGDGPAIEYANGDKFWYINGKCHREDGPAVEYYYGKKFWYYEYNLYTLKNYHKKMLKRSNNHV